jgi:hypothetical protein
MITTTEEFMRVLSKRKRDPDEYKEAVLSPDLRKNELLALQAAGVYGPAIGFFSDEIRSDVGIVTTACLTSGAAMKQAHDNIRNDPTEALKVIKELGPDGRDLYTHLKKRAKTDPAIISECLVGSAAQQITKAPMCVLKDKKVAKELLSLRANNSFVSLSMFDRSLWKDRDLLDLEFKQLRSFYFNDFTRVVAADTPTIEWIAEERPLFVAKLTDAWDNRAVMLTALQNGMPGFKHYHGFALHPGVAPYADDEEMMGWFLKNEPAYMPFCQKFGRDFQWKAIVRDHSCLKGLDPLLLEDEEFMVSALKVNWRLWHGVKQCFKLKIVCFQTFSQPGSERLLKCDCRNPRCMKNHALVKIMKGAKESMDEYGRLLTFLCGVYPGRDSFSRPDKRMRIAQSAMEPVLTVTKALSPLERLNGSGFHLGHKLKMLIAGFSGPTSGSPTTKEIALAQKTKTNLMPLLRVLRVKKGLKSAKK